MQFFSKPFLLLCVQAWQVAILHMLRKFQNKKVLQLVKYTDYCRECFCSCTGIVIISGKTYTYKCKVQIMVDHMSKR